MSGRGPYQYQVTKSGLTSNPGDCRHSRERTTNQNMRSTCKTCDRIIPANQTQCRFCDAENVKEFSPDRRSDTTDEAWSFGRVVLAVVPASNRYHAAALGSAAFDFADPLVDENHISHSDVQTIYDFTTAPAATLTSDWECELPTTVRIDTDHGQQLIESALVKTRDSGVDSTSAHLFSVEGAPIGTADELARLLESDETYWLVPGIVRRYPIPLPEGPTRAFSCKSRPEATTHVYTGRGGAPRPYDEPARPIWICTRCRRPTYGPESEADEVDSTTIPGLESEPVEGPLSSPPDRHEQAISVYYNRHGNYPWEETDGP